MSDRQEIIKALTALHGTDGVFEIRIPLAGRKGASGGYFNDVTRAADMVCGLTGNHPGVYVTLNPIPHDLLARAHNRISAQIGTTTTDREVLARRWLPVDIDPVRPAGTSSTNLEHTRALTKAQTIAYLLYEEGWPEPIVADSGNGAHLLFPLDLPNDDASTGLVRGVLKYLGERFDDADSTIDQSVYNASRIFRLYGTVARKGDNVAARPHRTARIVSLPTITDRLTAAQLGKVTTASWAPTSTGAPKVSDYPVDEKLFRDLNSLALDRLSEWVEHFFPDAKVYHEGYRITSSSLGRGLEEDVSIQPPPVGIKDFGVADMNDQRQGRRTAVSLLAEHLFQGDKMEAARRLAGVLGAPVSEFDNVDWNPDTTAAAFDMGQIARADELMRRNFAPPRWLVPDLLPQGVFFLTSAPKMRKSWMALQLCLATVTGDLFLGKQVAKAECLLLALEDHAARIKNRIEKLHEFKVVPDLSGFHYFAQDNFPKGEAAVKVIETYLDRHPDIQLVVIDTFAIFRQWGNGKNVYNEDYQAVLPLTRLAARKRITVLVVHHERKAGAGKTKADGDFMEDVSGSTGLTGGVDGTLSIKGKRGRNNGANRFMATGRDLPDDWDEAIKFTAELGGWAIATDASAEQTIIDLLNKHKVLTKPELTALMGTTYSPSTVTKALTELKYAGRILQDRVGITLIP